LLTLLHTAAVHVARFDALRDRIAPKTQLTHIVRADWLDRARAEGVTGALTDEIDALIGLVKGPVLCTCTTLGAAAEMSGAFRVDRPMMQDAANIGGRICLAYCLPSTAETSAALLSECLVARGIPATVDTLLIGAAWPAFESGDQSRFADIIADAVRDHVERIPETRAVVLAQASMDVAASRLADLRPLVLTAAESALRQSLTRVASQ
jgi:hypothetical protein